MFTLPFLRCWNSFRSCCLFQFLKLFILFFLFVSAEALKDFGLREFKYFLYSGKCMNHKPLVSFCCSDNTVSRLFKALNLQNPTFRSVIKQRLSKLLVDSDLIDAHWLSVRTLLTPESLFLALFSKSQCHGDTCPSLELGSSLWAEAGILHLPLCLVFPSVWLKQLTPRDTALTLCFIKS